MKETISFTTGRGSTLDLVGTLHPITLVASRIMALSLSSSNYARSMDGLIHSVVAPDGEFRGTAEMEARRLGADMRVFSR
jgi:hypothetical protein